MPIAHRLVSRPRLVERMNSGIRAGHKLTLISAPASFGKTTLLVALQSPQLLSVEPVLTALINEAASRRGGLPGCRWGMLYRGEVERQRIRSG